MPSVDLVVSPRDGLHFKDGREWHASASGRAHALDFPFPSSILGALRTAWGRRFEETTGARLDKETWPEKTAPISLNALLPVRRKIGDAWESRHRVWPFPADAGIWEGQSSVRRLDPEPHPLDTLGTIDDPALESLWRPRLDQRAKPLPGQRWWTEEDFVAWIAGGDVSAGRLEPLEMPRRLQIHVGMDPDRATGKKGALFSADILETLTAERNGGPAAWHEWALALSADVPDSAEGLASVAFTLGGDGRLGFAELAPANLFLPPPPLIEAFGSLPAGLRLFAVTPADFAGGWLPDGFSASGDTYVGRLPGLAVDLRLLAALVARPVHVSGWDLARWHPKPTRRLVPAGSAYFFRKADDTPFSPDDAAALWMAAMGRETASGFGRFVPGVWHPVRSA